MVRCPQHVVAGLLLLAFVAAGRAPGSVDAGEGAAVAARPPSRLAVGDHRRELRHGGRVRSLLVHVPPAARNGRPLPVLLSFHGGLGNAEQHRRGTGIEALADREGFVVVYPDGTGRGGMFTWNAGTCCGASETEDVDDVGFTLALLDDLGRRLPLDRRRIYATGFSNGGMMAHRLAAEAATRIAAIAPVAGGLVLQRFAPARPVPVLHIHSVDDPRALYHGGFGPPLPNGYRVRHPEVEGVMARWAAADGCDATPVAAAQRSAPNGDTATRLAWTGCAPRVEVGLWRLTGAGHVWPGAPAWRGEGSEVIDANAEIWRFVSRFRR
jgi:polyhydroxybutyrate depolymerase